jgi:ssDNA-binding Zn-finger/Zn-ribbon topoisomerase 1
MEKRHCQHCNKEFIVTMVEFPVMDDYGGYGLTIDCPYCHKEVEYVARRSNRDYTSFTVEDYEAKQKAHEEYERSRPLCPICGKKMTQRQRNSDKKSFWGCSDYPKCKGTRNHQKPKL